MQAVVCETVLGGTNRRECSFRAIPPQVAFLDIATILLNYANATESIKGKRLESLIVGPPCLYSRYIQLLSCNIFRIICSNLC